MGEYLAEARRFHEEAMREFERGKRGGDITVIRDAAEKAWGAVVQATNELIEKRGMAIPRTHVERRQRLGELERLDPKIKELGFRDRYGAREHYLHEDCFYDGICPIDTLEEDIFQKVKAYIEDVERL